MHSVGRQIPDVVDEIYPAGNETEKRGGKTHPQDAGNKRKRNMFIPEAEEKSGKDNRVFCPLRRPHGADYIRYAAACFLNLFHFELKFVRLFILGAWPVSTQ